MSAECRGRGWLRNFEVTGYMPNGRERKGKKVSLHFLSLPLLVVQFFWMLSSFYCDWKETQPMNHTLSFLWSRDFRKSKESMVYLSNMKTGWWYWKNIEYSTLYNQDNLMGLKPQSILKMNSNTWSQLSSILLQLIFWQRTFLWYYIEWNRWFNHFASL